MKFLVINHLVVEAFGIYEQFCLEQGINVDTVSLEKGDIFPDLNRGDYDALCIMGGPMNVGDEANYPWLGPEKALIRRAVQELQMPYLGICLGAQLLADALGGEVGAIAQPEVGIFSIGLTDAGRHHPLMAGIDDSFPALEWHGQEVKTLPPHSVVLASTPGCRVQAFAVGDRAFGLQFHHEICDKTLTDWLSVPAYRAELENVFGPTGVKDVEQQVRQHFPTMNHHAHILFNNFLRLISVA